MQNADDTGQIDIAGAEKESADGEYFATYIEVGRHYDVSERAVAQWSALGMPGERGFYPRSQIDAWLQTHCLGPYCVGRNHNDDDESRREADRRKAWAEAELRELDLATKRKSLVEVDDVVREYKHHATHARALLEQLPDRLLGFLPAHSTGDDKRHFRNEAAKAVASVVDVLHDWLVAEANRLEAEQLAAAADEQSERKEPEPCGNL